MISTKKIDKLKLTILGLMCVAITLFSIVRNTLANDGRIYFLAGKSINNGKSPWNSELDPFAQFLYGPINASLNSVLARSPYEVFITLIKLATCLLLFYSVRRITTNVNHTLSIYILCCCTFSLRSNLQYAAIGGIGSLLLILSIQNGPHLPKRWNGAAKLLLLDFKPHIYWFSIFLQESKKKIFALVSLAALTYLFIFLSNNDLSVGKWIQTIFDRKNGLASDPTLISPIFIIFHAVLPMVFLFGIHIATVIIVVIVCTRKSINIEITALVTYVAALLTTPYLHTIDTLGLTLITIAKILQKKKIGPAHLVLIFANCLWSTSVIFSSAIIALIVLTLYLSNQFFTIGKPLLIGVGSALFYLFVMEYFGIKEIPGWFYSLVVVLNTIAIFKMKSSENAK